MIRTLSQGATQKFLPTYLNLMDQYRLCDRTDGFPPLDRSPTMEEYKAALSAAEKYGLRHLD